MNQNPWTLQLPELEINKALHRARGGIPGRKRTGEQQSVLYALQELRRAGFQPKAVNDGEDLHVAITNKDVLEAVFNYERSLVIMQGADGGEHWFRCIPGEGPGYIIGDYSHREGHPFLATMEAISDAIDPDT